MPASAPIPPRSTGLRVPDAALSASRRPAITKETHPTPFEVPQHPPGVVPEGEPTLAQDDTILQVNAWANQALYNSAFAEGITFLGYTYLSELAQRPEYRRISEVLATEATRKWITLQAASGEDKAERIKELKEEMERLDVEGAFRRMVELDGFFGRAHLYLDLGTTDDREELQTPIGDGRNEISKAKIGKGSLKRIKPVEPVWCYPADYNANDPLRPDWYKPQSWFCQGKKIHSSRLLTFVGREVPDLLKPAYSFGGLSLSQMAKPYVDAWLRDKQSVSDLVWSFSVSILKTDLSTSLQGDGDLFFKRLALFTNLRNNRGVMALQNGAPGLAEEFENVSTPLSTLDQLQAQSQEHMCSVTGTPVVKLLGIQPAGLNASSQGEMETWYDWVEAFQKKFFTEKLTRVIHFIELSLWGEIDAAITFKYESLRSDDPVAAAAVRKTEAETGQIRIDSGVISPAEERRRVADDPDSPYQGLDPDDAPDLREEEEEGLEPVGGRPDPLAERSSERDDREMDGNRKAA